MRGKLCWTGRFHSDCGFGRPRLMLSARSLVEMEKGDLRDEHFPS